MSSRRPPVNIALFRAERESGVCFKLGSGTAEAGAEEHREGAA